VGDEADSQGPVVRETRGRRPAREGVNRRGNVFCKIRQRRARAGRLRGRVGWAVWAGEGWMAWASQRAKAGGEWAGRLGRVG
jgi:hypothetical protein